MSEDTATLTPAQEKAISDELFKKIKFEVESAVFNMVRYASAFALVLEHTKTFLTPRVPTAGVDQTGRLFVNPEFWLKQSPQQQMFLLAHEAMHVALLHPRRGLTREFHLLFNIVADILINRLLLDTFGTRDAMPEGGLLLEGYFYSEPDIHTETTVEELYDLAEYHFFALTKRKEKNFLGEAVHNKFPQQSEAIKEIIRKYTDNGGGGGGVIKLPPGTGGWGGGDLRTEDEGDQIENDIDTVPVHQGGADAPQSDEEWKDVAAQAEARATSAGQGSPRWGQLIGDLLKPKISWPQQLMQRVSSIVSKDVIDDYTYAKPNPLNYLSRVIFPAPIGHKTKGIVAIDTSGSMGNAWKQCIADFDHVRKKYNVEYYLMWQDAEIVPVGWLQPNDPLPEEAVGFGGTDFRQIFDHVEENGIHKDADFIVIFTDAWGPMPENHKPDALGLQVLWVLYDSDAEVPFGDVIKVESH